jgi:hypothetical protein
VIYTALVNNSCSIPFEEVMNGVKPDEGDESLEGVINFPNRNLGEEAPPGSCKPEGAQFMR